MLYSAYHYSTVIIHPHSSTHPAACRPSACCFVLYLSVSGWADKEPVIVSFCVVCRLFLTPPFLPSVLGKENNRCSVFKWSTNLVCVLSFHLALCSHVWTRWRASDLLRDAGWRAGRGCRLGGGEGNGKSGLRRRRLYPSQNHGEVPGN